MRNRWELVIVRIVAYVFFTLLFVAAWRIVNAQSQTSCRAVGQTIVCQTVPTPGSPQQPLDPSVIGHIPDSVIPSSELIYLQALQRCIQARIREGLPYLEARQRCLR